MRTKTEQMRNQIYTKKHDNQSLQNILCTMKPFPTNQQYLRHNFPITFRWHSESSNHAIGSECCCYFACIFRSTTLAMYVFLVDHGGTPLYYFIKKGNGIRAFGNCRSMQEVSYAPLLGRLHWLWIVHSHCRTAPDKRLDFHIVAVILILFALIREVAACAHWSRLCHCSIGFYKGTQSSSEVPLLHLSRASLSF